MKSYRKDPEAVLDYQFDWAEWLADSDDTIAAADVTITYPETLPDTGPLIIDSESFTEEVVTAWLSGGNVGEKYHLTAHILTDAGREDDRTVRVSIVHR